MSLSRHFHAKKGNQGNVLECFGGWRMGLGWEFAEIWALEMVFPGGFVRTLRRWFQPVS